MVKFLWLLLLGFIVITGYRDSLIHDSKPIATAKIVEEPITYNKVQQLYLDLGDDFTPRELWYEAKSLGLGCRSSESHWSLTATVAPEFTDKFSGTNSEHLSVYFDIKNTNQGKIYTLEEVSYINPNKNISAFHRIKIPRRADKNLPLGYYVNDRDYINDDGFSYVASSGNTIKTNYIKCNSKEEQLEYIHRYVPESN